jgi:hypothetical protein
MKTLPKLGGQKKTLVFLKKLSWFILNFKLDSTIILKITLIHKNIYFLFLRIFFFLLTFFFILI